MQILRRFAVMAVVLLIAAAPLLAQQPPQKDSRFEIQVTGEMIRHSRILDILYFTGFLYGFGVLVLVLATKASARLREAAMRVTKRPFLMAMIYVVLLTLVTTVIELPFTYYSGYVVPHQFNLSNQNLGQWLTDEMKELAISLVLGTLLGALALLGIRRVKRWWLALWIGSIPIMILLIVIAPVFLDPVFNKFEPLKDEILKDKLLTMASKAGIEGGRVYQVDKSKQTKTMNAYVTGIGPTKRIVMWDTLLAKMDHDEVLAVMGHEMGHYVLNHLWKGLAAAFVLSFVILFLAQRVYEWGIRRWGMRWGVTDNTDPAAFPWLLAIVTTIAFLLSPVMSGLSRYREHESDKFGLELTRKNEAMATAFIKLAEDSKINPHPHPFIEFWRYSHPSIGRRVDFVLQYKPWEKGSGLRARGSGGVNDSPRTVAGSW